MNITFEDAVNEGGRVRLAICGPAGGGKTVTLLKIAAGLAQGGKIAAIDTERGSMRKYAHKETCPPNCADPLHFRFVDIRPSTYHPDVAIEAIIKAHDIGCPVIIIDSLSHFWQGTGGELELVDQAAKRSTSGNSFTAWKSVTPLHNKLVETMLTTPIHVLVSMRSKTEWVIEKNERGKSEPRRVGLAPIMRDQIEFEFDVFGEINQEHEFVISKTRCNALKDGVFKEAGADVAAMLLEWLPAKAPQAKPVFVAPSEPQAATAVNVQSTHQVVDDVQQSAIREMVSRMKVGKYEALEVFGEMEADLVDMFGEEIGLAHCRRILAEHGVAKSDEFKTAAGAQRCAIAMYTEVRTLREAMLEKIQITDEDLPESMRKETTNV